MKPRVSEKSDSIPGSGYHRNCHMSYVPPLIRVPRRNVLKKCNLESAEKDYENEHESCTQKRTQHQDEIPVKNKRCKELKQERNIRENQHEIPVRGRRGYNLKQEKNIHETPQNHDEISVRNKHGNELKQERKIHENHHEIQVRGKRDHELKQERNIHETPKSYDEIPIRGKRGHELKQERNIYKIKLENNIHVMSYNEDELRVRGKRGNKMQPERNICETPQKASSHRIVECYIDNNYFNNPVAVNKADRETKKINFNIPQETSKEKPPLPPPPDLIDEEHVPMDWNNYHRLAVIHSFMDDLETSFPSLCTTGVIGTSTEGRNLKILKISNSDAGNACVWIDAGIHAREWIAPAVNTYLANHITRNFDDLPLSIKNKDWYFLPVVNPDGYEYSHTTDRMWRKNRAFHEDHCVGVDLNRNFSFGWGGKGSSDQPTNAFYRGPEPFSEPESSAMRDILLNSGINFNVYITLHSFGQVIIFPYACSSELAPDYVRLLEGATTMSKAIFNTNGNTYKVGVSRDVMYGAAGTSNDFAHGVVGIPYCYLIELRSKKHKFKLPKEEIEETGNEILNCVKALMEFIDSFADNKITGTSDDANSEALVLKRTNSKVQLSNSGEGIASAKPDPFLENSNYYIKRRDSNVRDSDYLAKLRKSSTGKGIVIREDFVTDGKSSYPPRRDLDMEESDSFMDGSGSPEQNPDLNVPSTTSMNPNSDSLVYARDCNKRIKEPTDRWGDYFEEWNDSYEKKSFSSEPLIKVISAKTTVRNNCIFFTAINIWKEERSTMDIMIEGPRTPQIAGMLHEREIPYTIAVADINTLLEREKTLSRSLKRNNSGFRRTMDWKSYHRLDTIYAFMDNLAVEYPHLCKVSVIGKSVEGRDLKMLKISNGNVNNSGVWLDGAIHPREWISPAVVTYIADRIVRTFNEQPESVTNKDWYVLPVMNPDGYEYTHTHDRMWRKNRARYGECVGVDLNRNFSYGFGEKGEEGSSDDPGNIFYRGPQAFSEPETAAVRRAILESPTTFKVFLSFHSYGEVIIFPWGYTSEPCPDYVELLEGGTAMAKAIFSTNGHTYKVGSTKDLMYYAAGTSIDWSYAVTNIQYSYMVELRGKTHRFLLPKEEILSTASEVLNGVLRLLDFVDRRCVGTHTCVCPK